MIRQERHRRIVLRVFVLAVCYLAVLMCLQEKVFPDLSFVFPGDRAVVFNQYNHFGYILCMGTLAASGLCLFDRSAGMVLHIVDALCAVFLIYALVLNDTFGAFLGAAFALVLLVVLFYLREKDGVVATLVHRRSFVVAAVLAVVAIIGAAVATGAAQSIGRNLAGFVSDIGKTLTGAEDMRSAGTGRMALWLDTLQRIGERPIFGFGPMGFVGDHVLTNGDVPHNEYLQIAGYLGLPGLALYLCALGSLIKSRLQRLRTLDSLVVAAFVVWVAYLASATFGNPVFNTAPFMWLMFGLATATTEEEPPLLSLDTQATH
jgi:O-antigen ligase